MLTDVDQLKARMNDRVNEIKAFETKKDGYDKLPADALAGNPESC